MPELSASGYIDPQLNSDNVTHSLLLLLLVTVHGVGATLCALPDFMHPAAPVSRNYDVADSTLWVFPMISKCVSIGNYSHFMAILIFSGLTFTYLAAAYIFLKTTLHIIFEYRVKLVFVEQWVVALVMICCMLASLPFLTKGGLMLLESVEAIMSGVTVPCVCLLELVGLLYVYRSHDFLSDMLLATEENTCSTRISVQWKLLPALTLVVLGLKIAVLVFSKLPTVYLAAATAALAVVLLGVPLRAGYNAIRFVRRSKRQTTTRESH